MTWTNAFDTGECTVSVTKGGTSYYSGILGKGDSSGDFTGAFGGTFSVSVDADGLVSMNVIAGSETDLSYVLGVVPSTSPGSYDTRLSNVQINVPDSFVMRPAAYVQAGEPDSIQLSGSPPSSFTPNPVDMSTLTTPHDGFYLYAGETT